MTHLDDLKINDDCECQEVVPPPRKFKPMHITFLIDGSDGYNEKTRNKIGYTEGMFFDIKNGIRSKVDGPSISEWPFVPKTFFKAGGHGSN